MDASFPPRYLETPQPAGSPVISPRFGSVGPDPPSGARWRDFLGVLLGVALLAAAAIFGFVAVIDPWDGLPWSPRLARLPVSSSSPYALPLLARGAQFDGAIIGNSTSRLLRPAVLGPLVSGRLVNLSFFAATAHEQMRMLGIFLDAHPRPQDVLIGLDSRWCDPRPQPDYDVTEFPEWLYQAKSWRGYRQIFTLYALREAASQLQAVLGRRPSRHGSDGYTDFDLPPAMSDPALVHAKIIAIGAAAAWPDPAAPASAWQFTTLPLLRAGLGRVPPGTRVLLFFVPFARSYQGAPGSPTEAYWRECKRRVVAIAAARPGTRVADFDIDSAFTRDEGNFLDAVHYNHGVADRVAAGVGQAAGGRAGPDHAMLLP